MQLESSVTLFDDDKVESKFAQLEITADGITSEVSRKVGNDEVISRINQSAEEVKIQADKVNIEGATIFSTGRLSQDNLNNAYDSNGAAAGQVNTLKGDLAASSGTTVIHGGHITTGTLDADTINANSGTFNSANIPNLNANKITAGTLSADRIGANSIGADKIKVSEIEIGAAQIASGTIDSARIPNLSATKITTDTLDTARLNISGVITAINNNGTTTIDGGKITTNSIGANKIKVAELVTIGPSTGAHAHVTSNGLDVYGNDGDHVISRFSGETLVLYNNKGQILSDYGRIASDQTALSLYKPGKTAEQRQSTFTAYDQSTYLSSFSNTVTDLYLSLLCENGSSSSSITLKQNAIVSSRPITVESDERLKKDFEPLDKIEEAFMELKPIEYSWKKADIDKSRDSKRHFGLKAQNVESALKNHGLDPRDYYIVTNIKNLDGEEYKTLAYEELIPMCIHMIQKLQVEIDELKSECYKHVAPQPEEETNEG